MSAIASFYVLPAERLTDIVAAATPAPAGCFRPARDTFWNVPRGARAGDIRLVRLGYGDTEEAAAVQAALTTLKAWLAEVSPRSVGLLSFG